MYVVRMVHTTYVLLGMYVMYVMYVFSHARPLAQGARPTPMSVIAVGDQPMRLVSRGSRRAQTLLLVAYSAVYR